MRLFASCSSAVAAAVRAPAAEAEVLGIGAAAVYLRTPQGVLALVATDALRLPCAIVLPVLPSAGPVSVGDGRVSWARMSVPVVREWAPARVPQVTPLPARVEALLWAAVSVNIDVPLCLDVESTLGRGPGLTPSGDDLLAGYLLGCGAFGVSAGDLAREVLVAADRTTALSAALLGYAVAGHCLPEVAAAVRALGGGPWDAAISALLRVGHTSGAALAHGLALAATSSAVAA